MNCDAAVQAGLFDMACRVMGVDGWHAGSKCRNRARCINMVMHRGSLSMMRGWSITKERDPVDYTLPSFVAERLMCPNTAVCLGFKVSAFRVKPDL